MAGTQQTATQPQKLIKPTEEGAKVGSDGIHSILLNLSKKDSNKTSMADQTLLMAKEINQNQFSQANFPTGLYSTTCGYNTLIAAQVYETVKAGLDRMSASQGPSTQMDQSFKLLRQVEGAQCERPLQRALEKLIAHMTSLHQRLQDHLKTILNDNMRLTKIVEGKEHTISHLRSQL